jgi:hypothetical protein
MRGSLFHGDDPAVDTVAPDTEARIIHASEEALTVEWRGDDNKPDALAFSWRIDEEGWSAWTADAVGEIPLPDPGQHVLLVRARDAWMNTDASPAIVAFGVDEPSAADEKLGCMCSTGSATPIKLAWLGLLPLLWLRRRQR